MGSNARVLRHDENSAPPEWVNILPGPCFTARTDSSVTPARREQQRADTCKRLVQNRYTISGETYLPIPEVRQEDASAAAAAAAAAVNLCVTEGLAFRIDPVAVYGPSRQGQHRD